MSQEAKAPTVLAPVDDVIQVRFSDTDAMGHISSGSYAAFAEVGRETFFKGIPDDRADIPWFVLGRLAMDYPSEARYGQVFTLSTRAIRIGDKSLTFEQVVKADGVVACRIEVVMVGFDPVTRKSAQVPRHWRLP
jgi:acyl-CoA thioester hydrolase